jgi:hypothetical protein
VRVDDFGDFLPHLHTTYMEMFSPPLLLSLRNILSTRLDIYPNTYIGPESLNPKPGGHFLSYTEAHLSYFNRVRDSVPQLSFIQVSRLKEFSL